MSKTFAPLLFVLILAGCAAPACRPVADNPAPAAAAPAAAVPPPAPVPPPVMQPAPASNEPGYLHASGGAFY